MSVVGEGGLAKSTLFITEIVTNLAKDILSIVKKIGQVLKKWLKKVKGMFIVEGALS